MQRDYGKPRPALVLQSNLYAELDSIVVVPITTDLRNDAPLFRLAVDPTAENGLRKPSQLMVDKVSAVVKARIDRKIGHADGPLMAQVSTMLTEFLELA